MCDKNDDKGLVTGSFCECDDSECLDEDTGEVCGGRLHSQLLLIPHTLSRKYTILRNKLALTK